MEKKNLEPKNSPSQKPFDKMIILYYDIKDIGIVKLTIGVKIFKNKHIQYCITEKPTIS